MSDLVIVAVISLVGTTLGTFGGIISANRLTNYKIECLKKEVEKHNGLVERMCYVEGSCKAAHHRIDELKG
jgi:hypothetical protein